MTKSERIFKQLQDAREKGVEISEIFNDWESRTLKNKTLFDLRKKLGDKKSIVVKNGKWFLAEYFWSLTLSEFNQKSIIALQIEGNKNIKRTLIATCILMGVFIFMSVMAYIYIATSEIEIINYGEEETEN